jgi:hypothetical protein
VVFSSSSSGVRRLPRKRRPLLLRPRRSRRVHPGTARKRSSDDDGKEMADAVKEREAERRAERRERRRERRYGK